MHICRHAYMYIYMYAAQSQVQMPSSGPVPTQPGTYSGLKLKCFREVRFVQARTSTAGQSRRIISCHGPGMPRQNSSLSLLVVHSLDWKEDDVSVCHRSVFAGPMENSKDFPRYRRSRTMQHQYSREPCVLECTFKG